MKVFFVDTSFWLALELTVDQFHVRALAHWQGLAKSSFKIVTTSYIFDETITHLNNCGHHRKAVEVGETFYSARQSNSSMLIMIYFLKAGNFFKSIPYRLHFIYSNEKQSLERRLGFRQAFRSSWFQCRTLDFYYK